MNPKVKYYWLLAIIPVCFLLWFWLSKSDKTPIMYLPYYGPKYAKTGGDSAYHTVGTFRFSDQDGLTINEDSVKNKIYVTEFFFTTCQSICPIMNDNLVNVYKRYKNDGRVLILSHTVDPETDSTATLKHYANRHGVTNRNWLFLTGDKKQLYDLARKSYLLDASEGDGGADDFVHTQNFALVDWNRHIRGFYDGTDSLEVGRMVKDMDLLLEEYAFKKGNNP